ncbi:MAG TPA: HAMP domain-containing sensor histidine kinase [Chthonomonadaceae bacterium]|nr:HAMP domain-containing sensor histidine kinase [Chthonomonadaceae bacterium]
MSDLSDTAEIYQKAERLAKENARLEATIEERRRFVAMILHDLRQPLAGLQTQLSLLQTDPDPAQREAHAQALQSCIEVLSRLLDGLLQYAEVEAGRSSLRIENVPLAALIQECIEIVAPPVPNMAAPITVEVAPDLETVQTDREKLTHILLNLLSNALKFTPQGSVCMRACRQGSERWLLEVADTGIGMSEEAQGRAFEEFFRPETEAETGRSGYGLGLAIVRQLCLAMGAELSLESAPGSGTRCRILFPCRPGS